MSSHFNSIKVRLELYHHVVICSTSHEFQFHKGTIRTEGIKKVALLFKRDFNSIKVRLEPSERDAARCDTRISIP